MGIRIPGPGNFIPDGPSDGGSGCGCIILVLIFLVIVGAVGGGYKGCRSKKRYNTQNSYQYNNQQNTYNVPAKKKDEKPTKKKNSKTETTEDNTSQYISGFSGRDVFIYQGKIRNLSPENVVDEYIRRFDTEYSRDNRDNEFKMQERRAHIISEIQTLLKSASFDKTHYSLIESELGEYDFTREAFNFNPFKDLGKGTMDYFGGWDMIVYYQNTADFNTGGLDIPKDEAEAILNGMPKYTISQKTDRRVWVKIYFKILNKKFEVVNTNGHCVGAFIEKIEIHLNRQASGKIIKTLYSVSQLEKYLTVPAASF